MKSLTKEKTKEHLLIAAHRGTAGGNLPCNTLAAYEAAIRQGADIVELDVSKSADEELFVFHPGMEPFHLRSPRYIKDMTAAEVKELHFVNQDGAETEHKISLLDEALEFLKDRCLVNIDKFWTCMPEITQAVRRHGMQEQVIVKTAAEEKWFDMVEEIAPDLPYMPIVSETDQCREALLKRPSIRYIGAEVLFASPESPTAQAEYREQMHRDGLLLWGNAIVYYYKAVLSAGHSDDESLYGNPDKGWGWLADSGFDIIQTDWVLAMRQYLERAGKYRR